ncbi:MAG: bis(5'-nucleosyl)-tetraphosphatase (symmetrical) YqeK [Treponemataceae bacterium]|nr:bis(5'-nucleosyl)-tetraphosphatase (symmetrical) YqeK [Treponemataceae bacterium]
MAKSIEELIKDLDKDLQKLVKPSRYEHSVRVAETAQRLCEQYDIEGLTGYLAGIAHDICKGMDNRKLLSLAKEDGEPITQVEEDKPALLHGRAAAMYIQSEYGITDPAVIEAVRYHTFGCPGMSDLAKIIYIADKIEPGRPQVDSDWLDHHAEDALDDLVILVLQENIQYLNEMGYAISPLTENFLYSLVKNRG